MTFTEYIRKATHREHRTQVVRLQERWDNPDILCWYLMQIALMLSSGKKNLDDFKIKTPARVRRKRVTNKAKLREQSRMAQMSWAAQLAGATDKVRKEVPK